MTIETLKDLSWTAAPRPPLGVYPNQRNRRWFRWYVTYQIEYLIFLVRDWRWRHRTGNRQDWCRFQVL